jgi:hypothetical protein
MTSRAIFLVLLALAGLTTIAEAAPQTTAPLVWYQEAHCPTVKLRPMVRMKRAQAVRDGLAPAPDCHPTPLRVTYLGQINLGPSSSGGESTHAKPVAVRGYPRADGTWVDEHYRAKPGQAQ